MNTTVKHVNYTPEQTARIVAGFAAGTPVEDLATLVGKSVRSVIAKLAMEKVYTPKMKEAVASRKVTKTEMVAKLAEILRVDAAKLESLEKATHPALKEVLDFVEAAQGADTD